MPHARTAGKAGGTHVVTSSRQLEIKYLSLKS